MPRKSTIKVALHLQAIKKWSDKHDPEFSKTLDNALKTPLENEGLFIALRVAFEAGRVFQKRRPKFPLNDGAAYLGL
jgi:hypothetical protein